MKQSKGLWFPDRDEHFSELMSEDQQYQSVQLDAACSFMKDRKIFIDIGAHVGIWTRMAMQRGFKLFMAIEPHPLNFECLTKNTEGLNGIITNMAVGTSDFVELTEHKANNTGAVSTKPADKGIKCLNFNKESPIDFDKLIAEHNIQKNECLIKIDVEGSELDVVKAMRPVIMKLKPAMVVEQKLDTDAVNYLCDLGMDVKGRMTKDVILSWE